MVRHACVLIVLASLPACFNPGNVDDSILGTTTTSQDATTTTTTTASADETTAAPPGSTGEPGTTTDVADTGTTGAAEPCTPNPCVNGLCTAVGDTESCECHEGWAGNLCDTCAPGFEDIGDECVAVASCAGDPCGVDATCAVIDDTVTCTLELELTGADQPWVVPAGVTSVDAVALGASGGCALAGLGGEAVATVPVMPGESLHVFVGGAGACSMLATLPGGYNGGGDKFTDSGDSWEGGSGGGATDLRRGGLGLADRVLVAGGGGGQGWGGQAGHGGGIQGETCNGVGGGCADETCGGRGGTQIAGGIGGFCFDSCEGQPGSLGLGGDSDGCAAAGGGGGGGYYGGGGGAHCSGGGGSSRVDFPGNTNTSTTAGVNLGNGQLTLTWRL